MRWLNYVNKYRAKTGEFGFTDTAMFNVLWIARPKEELATLFQSLRQVPSMKKSADAMQQMLADRSPSTHNLMNQVWLKSRESPAEVFNILRLAKDKLEGNSLFIQWLRYTELYSKHVPDHAFSDLQTMEFLVKTDPKILQERMGILFEKIQQIPDLKTFAKKLQTRYFQKWINNDMRPYEFGYRLGVPYDSWNSILTRPKSDPMFSTLKACTLQYAEELHGPIAMEKVKTLFDNNKGEAALTAAVKP